MGKKGGWLKVRKREAACSRGIIEGKRKAKVRSEGGEGRGE